MLSEQIATAVQAIVYVNICKTTGKRRIMQVKEIGPVADGVIRQREIFTYQLTRGVPTWKVVGRTSAHREALEVLESPVVLSSYPALLELDMATMYHEAAFSKVA